ncbi:hypothetical protein H8S95_03380 [Pontibacter sp. KCTC 32443]|uniref:hypothetical protein n=1 Tax=Pontibacter TaxID=323449 RepID=UPI00164D8D0A|nr:MULTISPECIES: hypothetical protein [Pontibacter]MBC5773093.1 hypothetical protein [Pontibacter sp. KCTC 32443]
MYNRFTIFNISIPQKLLLLLILLHSYGCARKNFYADTPVVDSTTYQLLQQSPGKVDSVTVQAGRHYERGFIYNALWGKRYRDIWAAPVEVKVLEVNKEKGGLKVEKIGGGMQTISASLVGGNGRTYSLRSVDKRPEVKMPFPFQNLFVSDLVRDQTSALNPYAALVVAPLSEAAGIPHPNPQLVYVRPNEEALGEHKTLLSDNLYMLEEKFNDRRALVGSLKSAENIVSTKRMLENCADSDKHLIDQVAFAKARLLDLLIGDRDRHEEQWEWAVYKENQNYIYRPIPKDRDNAFFRFDDGLFSWILSRKWAQRKFVTFYGDFRDVKALMIKSAYIDARALNQVTALQYDSLAKVLQHEITDEVIEKAVHQLPASVYQLEGKELAEMLKSRRNTLDKAAREFYEALAEEVTIRGTDKDDIFEVERLNNKEIKVIVRRRSDGKVTYRRIFNSFVTDEVSLKGRAGNDVFNLQEQVLKGIKISFEGDDGQDSLKNVSGTNKRSSKTEIRDIEIKK